MTQTIEQSAAGEILTLFIQNLGNLALEDVEAMLHDDCVFETPYSGAVRRVKGKKAVMDYLSTVMVSFIKHLDFTVTAVYPCVDPDTVVMEYESHGEMRSGGPYGNQYINVTRLKDGKIILFREYYNPQVIAAARAV